MVYIKLDTGFVEFKDELDKNYKQGATYEDYLQGDTWIKLSDEQVAFHTTNPNASVREVLNMQLNTLSDAELLVQAKEKKLAEIEVYDASDAVNGFTINGTISTWLTPAQRANYKNSIESTKTLVAAGLKEKNEVTFDLGGMSATISTDVATILLAQIQVYADACWLVTQAHKVSVNALTTVEEVTTFDITKDYPSKLNFNIS